MKNLNIPQLIEAVLFFGSVGAMIALQPIPAIYMMLAAQYFHHKNKQ